MKRILFVDDDPVVVRIYKEALSKQGFQVEAAHDGLTASKILQGTRPDLMVLDLMMPGNQGVEILNLARLEPKLADLPVIVFSNSYIDALPRDTVALGPQKVLLKVRCTPSILLGVVRELLGEQPGSLSNTQSTEPRRTMLQITGTTVQNTVLPAPTSPSGPGLGQASIQPETAATDVEFRAKARDHFLQKAASTCAGLHESFQAFARAKTDTDRETHLQNLYRKIHFLAAGAGLAECYPVARMASVFEAMLFEITNKSALQPPSLRRTIALAVDSFDALFKHAREVSHDLVPSARILVVDDDALSTRVVVSALRHAHLQATSTEDPLKALQLVKDQQYSLILLDIEMPGMDGFELCKRIRQLPGYRKTPVIYVTSHNDFESRAKSALSGGDDLIAKPVFAMELAVKVMTHLLSSQSAA